jgi:hypothetical protein
MANIKKKISAFTAATTVGATDLIPIVQGGVTKKVMANKLDDYKKINSSVTGNQANDLGGDGNSVNGNQCFAMGNDNEVVPFVARGLSPDSSNAFGRGISVYGYAANGIGQDLIVDGILGTAFGNTCICSGNDSLALGGQCVTGRRVYTPITTGADSLHGLGGGNKGFVLIDPLEGDCTPWFPDSIQYDPANPGVLIWALHPYLILKNPEEKGLFYLILKSIYTIGVGTKIWYDSAVDIGAMYVLGSYAPNLPVAGSGGNSMIAFGRENNAVANGAHCIGGWTKAWGQFSTAEGYYSKALGPFSHASGVESLASLAGQYAHGASDGKFNVIGDAQYTRQVLKISTVAAGWHDFQLLHADYGKSYVAETLLVGKQFSSTNGMVGESCAYKYKWYVDRGTKHDFATTDVDIVNNKITVTEKIKTNTKLLFESTGALPTGMNFNYIMYAIYVDDTHIQVSDTFAGGAVDITDVGSGTHSYSRFNFTSLTKELIGRSFVDDSDTVGDGLTTGIRADLHQTYFGLLVFQNGNIRIRIDGIATRSIRWVATTHYTEVI